MRWAFRPRSVGIPVVASWVFRLNIGRCHHHFGTYGTQRLDLLVRHFVGHDKDALIPADGSHESEAHSGVATGCLHDGTARLQESRLLGIIDDVDGDAVFH